MLSASISLQSLLVILLIVVLLFGTRKLGSIGTDLGNALKSFRKAMQDDTAKGDSVSADDKTLQNKSDSEHKK